jgi:hypothetical protein
MVLLASATDFSRSRNPAGFERLAILDPLHPRALTRHPRSMTGRFGWLGLCALLAAVIAARAFDLVGTPECRPTPVPLGFGTEIEGRILVSAGVPCPLSLRLGSARVDSLNVAVPPSHGVVTPRGRTGLVYRPFRGFRGEDAFSFSLHGRSSQSSGEAVVRVRVTVQ